MVPGVLVRAAKVVRGQDWWFYKIPPMLAAGYATALLFPSAPRRTLIVLAALTFAICMVACFGYVVNDLFDVEQDRRSGRRNTMAAVGRVTRLLLLVGPVAVAFGTLRLVDAPPVVYGLLGLDFLLPLLYSIPPVRLKERGGLGVIADAGAAHALPAALMVTMLTPGEQSSNPLWWGFFAATCGWSSFSGVRGIIVHQVSDQKADEAAGVVTFGGKLGGARARTLTFRLVVPLEIAALLAFLWSVVPNAPVVGIFTLLYAAGEIEKMRRGWTLPLFERPDGLPERYVPLMNNEFYELWLPLGLALQLALLEPVLLVLAVVHVVAFFPNFLVRIRAHGKAPRRPVLPAVVAPTLETYGASQARLEFIAGDEADVSRVTITSPDLHERQPWHVKLQQQPLEIRSGTSYTVRFEARADVTRPVGCAVGQAHEPYESLGAYHGFEVGTAWGRFECSFEAVSSDPDARLFFDLGKSDAPVEFRNIAIVADTSRSVTPREGRQDLPRPVAASNRR